MTIFILSEDPAECAKMLDDRSLERMIKSIAQTLLNVHWYPHRNAVESYIDIPGIYKEVHVEWTQWARSCSANYRYLVRLGIACCREFHYRNSEKCDEEKVYNGDDNCGAWHKMRGVFDWARDNEPDLPEVENTNNPHIVRCMFTGTPLPLVMPKKYIYACPCCQRTRIVECVVKSYRNFYLSKIRKLYEKCSNCNNTCFDENCYTCGMQDIADNLNAPTWTKRERPEFLEDL